LVLLGSSAYLIITNSSKNLIFFYTPSELFEAKIQSKNKIRIGGYVKKNSIVKDNEDKNIIRFVITDNKKDVSVSYKGILPDLFLEEKGAVVEGSLTDFNNLKANRVFAKHDENYMPANIKSQLEKKDIWKKNY
tara:strand:- start:155 stop:556 length:402 start_codon:yes stop_codon:yes gene_type:complete